MFRCCNENCSLLHSDCKNKHALSPVKDQGYKKKLYCTQTEDGE